MKYIVLLFVLVYSCFAQDSSLPDAPSSSNQNITCTRGDGKPCPKWVLKLVGQYPPFPDKTELGVRTTPAHVWTFRKNWNDPPLRQPFKSKFFLISQGIMLTSMIVACKRSQYTGEEFHSEAPWTIGVVGMDYLFDRYLDELFSISAASVVTQHYIRANVEGHINY